MVDHLHIDPRKQSLIKLLRTKGQYIDNNGDQLGEKVLSKYEKYQDQLDESSEFRKELEIEIGGLLLNMKSLIANDDKTRKLLDKVIEGHYELD